MFFFDDQTAFPRSTCVLIDPRPVKKDLREFQGNPYPLETMYKGFHKEDMALVDGFTETLVLDWDKTISVVEGVTIPLKM